MSVRDKVSVRIRVRVRVRVNVNVWHRISPTMHNLLAHSFSCKTYSIVPDYRHLFFSHNGTNVDLLLMQYLNQAENQRAL